MIPDPDPASSCPGRFMQPGEGNMKKEKHKADHCIYSSNEVAPTGSERRDRDMLPQQWCDEGDTPRNLILHVFPWLWLVLTLLSNGKEQNAGFLSSPCVALACFTHGLYSYFIGCFLGVPAPPVVIFPSLSSPCPRPPWEVINAVSRPAVKPETWAQFALLCIERFSYALFCFPMQLVSIHLTSSLPV